MQRIGRGIDRLFERRMRERVRAIIQTDLAVDADIEITVVVVVVVVPEPFLPLPLPELPPLPFL